MYVHLVFLSVSQLSFSLSRSLFLPDLEYLETKAPVSAAKLPFTFGYRIQYRFLHGSSYYTFKCATFWISRIPILSPVVRCSRYRDVEFRVLECPTLEQTTKEMLSPVFVALFRNPWTRTCMVKHICALCWISLIRHNEIETSQNLLK